MVQTIGLNGKMLAKKINCSMKCHKEKHGFLRFLEDCSNVPNLINIECSVRKNAKNVDEAVDKLSGRGAQVLGVVCHVSNAQQRKNLIDKTIEKYGRIDVIVSNAAVNPSVEVILETKESILDKLWEINVKASILILQVASPHLKKGSSVVFISSIAGYMPPTSMAMYGVTKTALLGLTKMRNSIAPRRKWEVMVDLFFYREPEEAKEQEA